MRAAAGRTMSGAIQRHLVLLCLMLGSFYFFRAGQDALVTRVVQYGFWVLLISSAFALLTIMRRRHQPMLVLAGISTLIGGSCLSAWFSLHPRGDLLMEGIGIGLIVAGSACAMAGLRREAPKDF